MLKYHPAPTGCVFYSFLQVGGETHTCTPQGEAPLQGRGGEKEDKKEHNGIHIKSDNLTHEGGET